MKQLVAALIVVSWISLTEAAAEPEFVIKRPTVIAFYASTKKELAQDKDGNETLSDFLVYAYRARERLKNSGVDFQEVYAPSFRVRYGKTILSFRPTEGVGYYYIAPGGKPGIEYGVIGDDGILEGVQRHLG